MFIAAFKKGKSNIIRLRKLSKGGFKNTSVYHGPLTAKQNIKVAFYRLTNKQF